jgi:hypothetical protein
MKSMRSIFYNENETGQETENSFCPKKLKIIRLCNIKRKHSKETALYDDNPIEASFSLSSIFAFRNGLDNIIEDSNDAIPFVKRQFIKVTFSFF